MIDHATVARIQDAAQIVDVVSDFVTLKKRGVNFVGLCPFHDDRSPSFYVSPAKNLCKCFSCGEGGSPVHFVMKKEQLSYPEALKHLARKYHIEVVEKELTAEEKQLQSDRESLFILNEYARDYFVKMLHENPEGKAIGLTYFRERGFRDDIVKKFQLGYGLEQRDAFSQEAQKAGYRREYLLKTGLSGGGENNMPLYDRFRGRVIFPIHTLSGKVVGFGGRILKKADNLAKYVNSPESEIYSKSNELYGIYFAKSAIVKQDKSFLVEGYTDVISMHQAGIENVVASSGTALTKGQIRMLHRFSPNITMLYDGDPAGIKAALRGIDLLLEDGMNVKVVLLPEGEDPDSFAKKQNAEDFNKYIAENEVDFIRFKTQLLLQEVGNDPIKRAGLISNVVQSISLIPNQIARSVYIQECAKLLDMRENVLIAEVNKIHLKNYDKRKENQGRETVDNPLPSEEVPEITLEKVHKTSQPKNPYERFEREILRYVVRYGNTPIYRKYETVKRVENKKVIEEDVLREVGPGVTEFVRYDLERDHFDFSNPFYKQIFEEACRYIDDENFDSSSYFTMHIDPSISKLAIELVSDRYELSQYHSKQLGEEVGDEKSRLLEQNKLETLVPRATTELKNEHILQKIKAVKGKMKTVSSEDCILLISELKGLQEFKKALAKELGERIVLRY
jgi:DNA primase